MLRTSVLCIIQPLLVQRGCSLVCANYFTPGTVAALKEERFFYDMEEICQWFLPYSYTGEKLLLSSNFDVLFQHVQFVFLNWVI